MKKLPIGISTLSTILENDMVYVDKTWYVHQLAAEAGRCFLSRPRRFGKSLLVDTFKSLFEGKEELFRGLYIHDKWDWNRRLPVIKIDFGTGGIRNRNDLELYLYTFLKECYKELAVPFPSEQLPAGLLFRELIVRSSAKTTSKTVILIDEYDKPLLDNIEKLEVHEEIRDGLRDFYSVIKEQDANIQFVFLTGVSKFSKVSIFSGINNLQDLTLSQDFAACCGYTEADLDNCFGEHLAGVDRALLKTWYNGYNFLGEMVYNPFDILLFIKNHHSYRSWWFETGTPTFLLRLFQKRKYFLPELEGLAVGEEILSSFEPDRIEPATLLFQTGYLTIKESFTHLGRPAYVLGFPNFEVKTAFSDHLINAYTDITSQRLGYQDAVHSCLMKADMPGLEGVIKRLFAGIAYRNFTRNDIASFEGYYASVLYAFFSSIDCVIIPEDISNQGQTDLTVQLGDYVYVMEIKVVKKASGEDAPNPALEQIISKDYAGKYRGVPGKQVVELGLVFGKAEGNLVQYGWR
jgi:hypothetical protein